MRKTPEELLEEHKERHQYAQYNRLIKRKWFPLLDAAIVKLKLNEKINPNHPSDNLPPPQ